MSLESHTEPEDEEPQKEQPLVEHLIELRSRLLRAIIGVLVVFAPLAVFAQRLFTLLADPLLHYLPKGSSMIATEVTAPFFVPFKFAMLVAVVVCVPWVLYQMWAFVAPGLYRREKRLVFPLLVSSTLLFYIGMAFAYFVVFPIVFRFMVSVAPTGVTVMTDMSKYLDFVMTLFIAFGVAFETPVAIILLVWMGFVTPEKLSKARPYVFICAFVIGMLLTPPDMFSQTMVAVPAYGLYEIGIFFAKRIVRRRQQEEADES